MYKLVAFDLDGTIAESKQVITPRMATLLGKLSKISTVAIISGGSYTRFEEQVLARLVPSSNIILLPAEGSERFEYKNKKWEMTDKEPFSDALKKKVTDVLKEIIADPKFEVPPYPVGEYIEDRDTEIAFSGLGQNAPLVEKEKWDPDKTRRMKIKAEIERRIPEVTAAVAGTTSIDILPKGFDKAVGLGIFLKKTGLKPEEMVFVGDAIVPGGNDYSVFAAGIKSIPVSGPMETMEVIEKMLQENVTTPETHQIPEFPKDAVAYFCAEFAFEPNPLMYAGGLGILAGDMVLESAELDRPFVGVGLRYGNVIPTGFGILEGVTIDLVLRQEKITAKVWHRAFSKNTHVLLLDAGDITSHLYDADFYRRVSEQIILGIGGIRLLKKLDIHPRVYHLNEGHTAFAAVGIALERPEDKDKVVGSKHTILSAAGLQITKEDLESYLGSYCAEAGVSFNDIFEKGKFELNENIFSTTKCVMTSSRIANGVSNLHVVYEKKVHPHSTLIPITNGVYRARWQAPEFLKRNESMSSSDLLKIKRKLRMDLFSFIETTQGKKFNPDICTLVWARRFASYKRPFLLFSDFERLTSIVSNAERPLQIVISGKAPIGDTVGEESIQKIIAYSGSSQVKNKIVYIPDYSITSAEKFTRGADIWLNTPELGKEACGTSGMKAGLNGALQMSVRDGWVEEISLDGIGWSLPGDKNDIETAGVIYDLLEHEALPAFYEENKADWLVKMKGTMELIEKNYTAERMIRDYEQKLYTW